MLIFVYVYLKYLRPSRLVTCIEKHYVCWNSMKFKDGSTKRMRRNYACTIRHYRWFSAEKWWKRLSKQARYEFHEVFLWHCDREFWLYQTKRFGSVVTHLILPLSIFLSRNGTSKPASRYSSIALDVSSSSTSLSASWLLNLWQR